MDKFVNFISRRATKPELKSSNSPRPNFRLDVMPETVLQLINSYLDVWSIVNLIKSANRVLRQKLVRQGGIISLAFVAPSSNLFRETVAANGIPVVTNARCIHWGPLELYPTRRRLTRIPPTTFFAPFGLRSLTFCYPTYVGFAQPFVLSLEDLPSSLTHLEVDTASPLLSAMDDSVSSDDSDDQDSGGFHSRKPDLPDVARICPNLLHLTYLQGRPTLTSSKRLISHLPDRLLTLMLTISSSEDVFQDDEAASSVLPPMLTALGLFFVAATNPGGHRSQVNPHLRSFQLQQIPRSVIDLQLPSFYLEIDNKKTQKRSSLPDLLTRLHVYDIPADCVRLLPTTLTELRWTRVRDRLNMSGDEGQSAAGIAAALIPGLRAMKACGVFHSSSEKRKTTIQARSSVEVSRSTTEATPKTSVNELELILPRSITSLRYHLILQSKIFCYPWLRKLHVDFQVETVHWSNIFANLRAPAFFGLVDLTFLARLSPVPETLLLPAHGSSPLPPSLTRLTFWDILLEGPSLIEEFPSVELLDNSAYPLPQAFLAVIARRYPHTALVLRDSRCLRYNVHLKMMPQTVKTLFCQEVEYSLAALPPTLTKLFLFQKYVSVKPFQRSPPEWRLPASLTEVEFDCRFSSLFRTFGEERVYDSDDSSSSDDTDDGYTRLLAPLEEILRQCPQLRRITGGKFLVSPLLFPPELFDPNLNLNKSPWRNLTLPDHFEALLMSFIESRGISLRSSRLGLNAAILDDLPPLRAHKAALRGLYTFSSGHLLTFLPGLKELDLNLAQLRNEHGQCVLPALPNTLETIILSHGLAGQLLWEFSQPLPSSLKSVLAYTAHLESHHVKKSDRVEEKYRFPKFAQPFSTHRRTLIVQVTFARSIIGIGDIPIGDRTLPQKDITGSQAESLGKLLGLDHARTLFVSDRLVSWTSAPNK